LRAQTIVPDSVGSSLGYVFVQVGDPENPDDDTTTPAGSARGKDFENAGVGYVGQAFAMGQSEVTNEMYVRFLNAVAFKDRLYGLYSDRMSPDKPAGGGIRRTGSPQSGYTYSVEPGFEQKPVSFVSGFDAMRFCNWLHNGMPGDPQAVDPARRTRLTSDQDATSTEDGAYTLLGANNDEVIRRNPGAKYYLPDQDEWHKAAYYDPLPGPSYWWFADQTYSGPGGNYNTVEILGVDYRDLKDVKTSAAASHYGTFDQDGNVDEWLDASITSDDGNQRLIAEQSLTGDPLGLFAVSVAYTPEDATTESRDLGFRVALRIAPADPDEAEPLMVEISQTNNLADEEFAPQLGDPKLGTVNYTFQMGAYEVTNREYAKFLNAKAKEDSFYRLYDTRMGSDNNGGITRSGPNGSYVYTVKPGFGSKPVVYVSIFSAMRYCNWLHNGGRADSDMEAGAYRLLGNVPPNTDNLTRNAGARYYLPNANEFYKAAYYDPTTYDPGETQGYWKFATRSDTFNATNNSSALAAVDAVAIASYFGTYGQSGNVGYVSPGSGANTAAPRPTADNTGELLEEATNTDDEFANRTFRIAAAAGMSSLRTLGDEDGDGLSNAWEVLNGLDPRSAAGNNGASGDPDLDGLTNLQELQYGLDPLFKDADKDSDGDGLSDLREADLGTRPDDKDTDDDLLEDGEEVDTHRTNPLLADTDNDGASDFQELIVFGTNPLLLSSVPDAPLFAKVGNPGNPDEDSEGEDVQNAGVGYVGQEFEIGTTEVTNLMYARFLNAVAKSDALYGLYSAEMGSSPRGGIVRSGSNGSYTYTVKPGFGGRPVNYVSVFDAMRYCNWLHNGMPTTGGQNASTTEDGAYKLNGTNPPEMARRSFGAKYFLPDQDEWHKAAYYDPAGTGSASEDYWLFADRSPMGPGGNFGVPRNKPVGTISGTSYYGTFDQDGNIREWLDASIVADERLVAGGGCVVTVDEQDPTIFFAVRTEPESENFQAEELDLGFRVARAVAGAAVAQETVPMLVEVGQPGNLADEEFAPQLGDPKLGTVNYTFQMGAYEVTNREYAKFLNAKAKEDSFFRLYDTRMGSDAANGGITRTGSNGSYVYTVKPGFGSKPVVYVSIFSAMRYCNWLHNGGRADSDMEAGAYRLLGNIPLNTANLTRNATARYYLPNANEFYKAAYYDSSTAANATFDYWKFATRSDTFNATNNSAALAAVDAVAIASYFGTYGQSGNVGYVSPGSGANTAADEPTAANTGELLEEADNTEDEFANRTFRIAAAAGVPALRPLGDEDSDGMSNAYEIFNDLDPGLNDAGEDPDKDGLTNIQEFEAKTDPKNKDTDNDGMDDGWEVQYGLDPKSALDASQDADGDGLTNLQEFQAKTDPRRIDTDGDGLSDSREVALGTNPTKPDTDGDTLTDGAEVDDHKTDPLKPDTDGDGFADNIELLTLGTDPLITENCPFYARVGDPGNPDADDPTADLENDGIGHVGQEFDIGVTEVTNLMYAKFLDSVAASDFLYGLYSTLMGTDPSGGIVRLGTSGNYRYAVKPGYAGRPVNFVSAFDAMRYCNWLHNGMPTTQVQDTTTTEDGAYRLLGRNTLAGIEPAQRESVRRTFGAKYFLPDEDEWYKAAYYDPEPGAGRPNASYWPFADQTTSGPGGNFSDLANRPVASNSGPSHYGTFDQDGNITEWTESTIIDGTKLAARSGAEGDQSGPLTLHIDVLNEKFWLTGQASGLVGSTESRLVWATFSPLSSADPQNQTTSVGMVGDQTKLAILDGGLSLVSAEIGSTVWPNGGFRFALRFSGAGAATIRGAGSEAAIDIKGVDAGATLNFREGQGNTASFEVGDSSFGPLVVKSSDIDAEEPDSGAAEALVAVSERFDLGFRVARSVELAIPAPAALPRMVRVGSPGNPADLEGKGAVVYEYQIGAYEVTNAEYTAFLNAVAKSDSPYKLYDIRMSTGLLGGIDRTGSPGAYVYAPKPGFANKPVVYVTFYNALRYCNWLHNGGQAGSSTEFGAYRLLGSIPPNTSKLRRNFGARYFLPNEDEWHKAAYYDPEPKAALLGNYWDYAIRSQSANSSQIAVGGLAGLVDVDKPGLKSYFGTYGQNGNAAEWSESVTEGERLVLGGGVASDWAFPDKAVSILTDPAEVAMDCGFRIAARADAPSSRMITPQTVKFSKLAAKRVLGTKPLKIRLRAKSTSGEKVQFLIEDPDGISTFYDGTAPYLIVNGPGTLKITARQAGQGTWAAAESLPQTVEIVPRAVRTK
jgi:formylglycine-generating enzyme required for sulfatase activity